MTEATVTQVPLEKKPSGLRKFFKRLFITLFILILVLSATGIILVWKYQDEAKNYVIAKLNERLNTQVIVQPKDIDFSVFRNFPNASVDFRNVTMLDAVVSSKAKDTLFHAELISLQFNLVDIFRKNYVIKRINVNDADLQLRIDRKGKDNFHFLKVSSDTGKAADTSAFALDNIQMKNIRVHYTNKKRKDDYAFKLLTAEVKGQFSSKEYLLKSDLKFFVEHIRNDGIDYIQNRNINLTSELNVSGTKYSITKANLDLEKLALSVNGTIDNLDSIRILHLDIGGKNMDIQSACSWMPGKFKKDIEEFDSKGNFYFHTSVNGTLSKKSNPEIKAIFGVSKGEIRQTKENLTMKNVELQGEYSTAGKGKLNITNFSGVLPEGSVKGNVNLENFSDPFLNAKAEGNVNLSELQKFLRIDTIESLSGKLKLNATFAGHLHKKSDELLNKDKTSGEMIFAEVTMRLKKNNLHFDNFSGTLLLENNDVELKEFQGTVSNSDFIMEGTFKNMLAWLLIKDEPLIVNATLKAKKIDLNDLLNDKTKTASKNDPSYKLSFSKYLDLTLHTEIANLVFRKFEANNILGSVHLKDKLMNADPLRFQTMEGNITINGTVDGTRSDSLLIGCNADFQKVNITRMFTQLENFGQQTLEDKNIKGTLSAKTQMVVTCGANLSLNSSKLIAKCDVNIVNGELIKLASLKSLSKFIKMSELEDIKFSTLSTSLNIRNRMISLPETQVNSSAIDIEVSGTQDFDGNVDYLFGLYLSEFLAQKAKARRKENNDFGEEDAEGKHRFRLYISMKGPIENPVIAYDHKAAQKERKEKRKEEKQNIKSILNEEFGLFRNDSIAIKKKKTKKNNDKNFTIKFDEEEKKKADKKDDGDF